MATKKPKTAPVEQAPQIEATPELVQEVSKDQIPGTPQWIVGSNALNVAALCLQRYYCLAKSAHYLNGELKNRP